MSVNFLSSGFNREHFLTNKMFHSLNDATSTERWGIHNNIPMENIMLGPAGVPGASIPNDDLGIFSSMGNAMLPNHPIMSDSELYISELIERGIPEEEPEEVYPFDELLDIPPRPDSTDSMLDPMHPLWGESRGYAKTFEYDIWQGFGNGIPQGNGMIDVISNMLSSLASIVKTYY